MSRSATQSARLHDELPHPVIDSDGHLQEFTNLLRSDILAEALEMGGPALASGLRTTRRSPSTSSCETAGTRCQRRNAATSGFRARRGGASRR